MSSLTYKFYSDAALTVPITAISAEQLADGSSNPVVKEVWLGDPEANFLIQEWNNPGVNNIEVSVGDTSPGTGHEATEVKLAATAEDLATAVAGAPFVVGLAQNSGIAGAVKIFVQIDDVTGVEGTTSELSLICSEVKVEAV